MHLMKPSTVSSICILITFCFLTNVVQSTENETEITTSDTTTPIIPEYLQGKHGSIFECNLIVLENGEYELFPNGTLYIEAYNMLLNESFYILENDTVKICPPFVKDNHEVKEMVVLSGELSVVGLIISIICLFLHLITFSFVPDMRNLPGWNLAALCLSLLCSYILLVMIICNNITDYRNICVTIASLIHFFLISAFVWMSIMSFDVFMSLLRATGSLRTSSTQFKLKKFAVYSLCAFGVALLLSVLGILADVLEDVPRQYKPNFEEICWFSQRSPLMMFFGGPVIALTCLNFIFFALSTYTIHTNKMKSDKDCTKTTLQRNYLMYFRLSVIMGITWTTGIVAATANVNWLWYLFVFLNTLQGLFIFLAFTCTEKAKKYFRQKLMGGRRGSEQTLAPTFQSYCFYANSIEKDLDKIVDINSKEKTDTIVIHL